MSLLSLHDVYSSYAKWVGENPQTASDFETTTKWISYFIAGRLNNSHVVSELVYSLSNLLVLFNDRIINNMRTTQLPGAADRLKVWLTVLEYCEVFLELSANKLWGLHGKWLVVLSVQIFKCVSKIMLVYHYKESTISDPPILMLQRRNLQNGVYPVDDLTVAELAQGQLDSISFTLKHSGKVIRKVDSSPPVNFRSWKPIANCDNDQTIEKSLAGRQLIAETMYIVKPIVHLGSVACFGNNTWKPWVIALLIDLYSFIEIIKKLGNIAQIIQGHEILHKILGNFANLMSAVSFVIRKLPIQQGKKMVNLLHLYKTCTKTKADSLTAKQRLQISRRNFALLMYLLRSPFYDRHSKDYLQALLKNVSKRVPLAALVCTPIMQYLPFWQSTYFYMWSN